MFDLGPVPNELTQGRLLRYPSTNCSTDPFLAHNHWPINLTSRKRQSLPEARFTTCQEPFVPTVPLQQYSFDNFLRSRSSFTLSTSQNLPLTATIVSPTLSFTSSTFWTHHPSVPAEFNGTPRAAAYSAVHTLQSPSSIPSSCTLATPHSNCPTDFVSPSSIDSSSPGTSHELDDLGSDLNSKDPLMTDVVGDLEAWPFAYSKLFANLDPDQCTLCSTTYALQSCSVQCPQSTSASLDALRTADCHSGYSNCSFNESPSLSCIHFSESSEQRKPKFFRSLKCHHSTPDEHHGSRRAVPSFTNGPRKRWNPLYSSVSFRKDRYSKPFIRSQDSPASTCALQSADNQIPSLHCGSQIVFQTDEGYMSDPTTTLGHSPYAFDESPASKPYDLSLSYARCQSSTSRHNATHGSKRLHLLPFILKLLHEHKRDRRCARFESYHHGLKSTDSKSGGFSPSDCVEWCDEAERIFTIRNPVRLAQLWGTYKSNRNMTFASLCRSLRLYYVSGKLERVRGQRNQYRLLGPVR